MMPVTFDTCIFISYRRTLIPAKHLLSSVVVQELIAGAADDSGAKTWAATAKQLDKENRVLTPSLNDWIEAGRILNNLLRGARSKNRGKTPKLSFNEKQRINSRCTYSPMREAGWSDTYNGQRERL